MGCQTMADDTKQFVTDAEGLAGGEDEPRHTVESPKILLIDDDPVFRSIMVRLASSLGLKLDAFESLLDVEPFSRINDYNGAIIDCHLGQMDGLDLLTHLNPFFADIPTLLVSADASVEARCSLFPTSRCRHFVPKGAGALKILEKVKGLVSSQPRQTLH